MRNTFRIHRIPLADVTSVAFRKRAVLRLVAAAPAAPAPAALALGRPAGRRAAVRHAGHGVSVAAARLGTAYWSGRRTGPDEIAEAIAAAAGLPPLPPRPEIISPRRARRPLGVGMALLVPAGLLETLGPGSGLAGWATNLAGRMLRLGAAVMIGPAAAATLDRCARWRGQPGRALDRVL